MGVPSLKYCCTALQGTNKGGTIKPDGRGYYRLCVGALNHFNSAGLYYDYETSKQIFDNSATFMRCVNDGTLYSEEGHPKWEKGMTYEQYIARIRWLEESNLCAHIRSVDFDFGEINKLGERVTLIYADVKPDRAKGVYLKEALDNPDQNVCFSIRSLVNDWRKGAVIRRTITECVTFDWVREPGISAAKKWNAPGLEARGFEVVSDFEQPIPLEVLRGMVNNRLPTMGVGMEARYDDSLAETLKRIDTAAYGLTKPSVLTLW